MVIFVANIVVAPQELTQITFNMEYKKLLIQQQTVSGSTYTDVGDVVDTQASYRVVCQEFPFKRLPEIKELAKRDWYDENGDDVYIPTDGLKFKAYDIDVTFLYVGSQAQMYDDIKGFVSFLYGRNAGGSPILAVYDLYTKTGRRGIYVSNVDNELYEYDDKNPEVIAQFKVKFHVTDPITDITLTDE